MKDKQFRNTLVFGLIILIGMLIISIIKFPNEEEISYIDIELQELSENKEDYVEKPIRTMGYVTMSVGGYFGEKYVLRTSHGIQQKSGFDGIALSRMDLESYVAFTWDGRTYNSVNVKPATVEGIVKDRGRVVDAAQYYLEITSIEI